MYYKYDRPLMEQLDRSLLEHMVAVCLKEDGPEIIDAYFLQSLSETHYYLKVEHDFKPNEVAALLQFADPLAVARECWERRDPEKGFPICDLLKEIKAWDRFPLVDPIEYAPRHEQMIAVLKAVLDQNMTEYHASLLNMDKEELIAQSAEIAVMQKAYNFMKKDFKYERGDADSLLHTENPLKFVVCQLEQFHAGHWPTNLAGLLDSGAKSPIEELNALLDKNMADFDAEYEGLDNAEIAELPEVEDTRITYSMIRNDGFIIFDQHEAEVLLRLENPLQFIVESSPKIAEAIQRLESEMSKETPLQPDHDRESSHNAKDSAVDKKLSIREQLKTNQQKLHQQPPPQERSKGGEAR